MPRKLVSSGSTFEAEIGYSRAVVDGDWVFVSGTTGFDYTTMTIADDIVLQAEQCLKNIEQALNQAGEHLRRDVNPVVMTKAAFEAKLASRDRFVAKVAREPKIFLLGDADEFAELAENRPA